MDGPRFDALTRVLALAPARRALLPLLAAPVLGDGPTEAKKKKKKKTTLCLAGQTVKAAKKKKKKLLRQGATPGPCPPVCTPNCPGTTCGADDGCGGTCGCAAGSLCYGGVCTTCTVACTGNATACGNELATALNGGGTVYACPGRYVGNFTLNAANVSLIGAGQGGDPATNTILDANGSGRVVAVAHNVNAALHGLRVTGGNPPQSSGAGIQTVGTLTLTACTVTNNEAGGGGGGIHHASGATGPLTLNDCVVSENKADTAGGGIRNSFGGTLTVSGSAITGNTAASGGGLHSKGTATFDSSSTVTGNTATADGGGIFNEVGSTVTLNGASVTGNSPNNCFNVPTC